MSSTPPAPSEDNSSNTPDATTPDVSKPPVEWNCTRGWKASIKEGVKPIFFLGLGTSISTMMGSTGLLLPIMLPTGILCTIGIPIAHAYFANKYLLNPGYRRLEPSRRLFLRWGGRVAFANLIALVYSPATLFSVVVSPLAFMGFVTIQKRLLDMQLYRQENNMPLAFFERMALGLLMFITVCVVGCLIVMAGLFGFGLEWALEYFNLLPQTTPA
jgi:hypothetical protein